MTAYCLSLLDAELRPLKGHEVEGSLLPQVPPLPTPLARISCVYVHPPHALLLLHSLAMSGKSCTRLARSRVTEP